MPTWFKAIVSAILITFMIALSASVEAEAADLNGDMLADIGVYDLSGNDAIVGVAYGSNGNGQLSVQNYDAVDGVYLALYNDNGTTRLAVLTSSYVSQYNPRVNVSANYPNTALSTLSWAAPAEYDFAKQSFSYPISGSLLLPLTVYPTVLDAIEAIVNFAPSPTYSPFAYNLPPGYALYLDVSGLDSVSVSSVISANSGTWRSPYRSNQYVRFFDDLPARGSTIQPSGEQIVYTGSGDTNLIGLYRRATYGQTFAPTRQYLVIYNPLGDVGYGGENGNSGTSVSPTMQINVSLVRLATSHLYSLSTNIMSDGLISDVSGDYDLVDSDGTITAVDDNGNIYTPVVGGATLVDAPRDINDFLQSIANDVSGFFNGAISAVTTLVNSGSAFIGLLGQLYTWLPSEVFFVLKSALILVITIGVIKVFV